MSEHRQEFVLATVRLLEPARVPFQNRLSLLEFRYVDVRPHYSQWISLTNALNPYELGLALAQ
jgi:hypothetical protein